MIRLKLVAVGIEPRWVGLKCPQLKGKTRFKAEVSERIRACALIYSAFWSVSFNGHRAIPSVGNAVLYAYAIASVYESFPHEPR